MRAFDTNVLVYATVASSPHHAVARRLLMAAAARHPDIMAGLLKASGATGNLVHDAHIAALCLEHGVTELVTGDRDFSRFSELKAHNPF